MAGESAREQARRRREKAERLQRSAESWERGADGEEATARVLAELPTESWTVFHDIRWPGRRYANVDHVAVGPPGVFMIDSKNWTGPVTIKDDVLRLGGWRKEREVAAAAEAALAVGGLVPSVHPDLVHPVLCFVRDEPVEGWARDVMVCSTSNLLRMLTTRPDVLPPDQLRQLCLDLDAGIRSAGATPQVDRPARRPVARHSSSPAGQRRRRRRKSSSGDLVKAVVAAVVLGVILLRPDVATGVAERFGDFWVDTVDTGNVDTTEQELPATDRQNVPEQGNQTKAKKRANRN